jgi:ParB family transcriptional regulator, chromosome partitioning protein
MSPQVSRSDAPAGPSSGTKRPALGKGLESLLGPRPPAQAPQAEATGKPLDIPVERVDRNPFQTRTAFDEAKLDELASSIAEMGVLQPITVRPLPDGRYQLITGERRWRASQKAGKQTVPAIVRQVSDEQAMEMTIVENLQRADLNAMEQARAYQRLAAEFNMTQEQMATRTGKDRASVGNFLRLLKLPADVQGYVESGELSFGQARTLLALGGHEAISAAARKVAALAMSVRQTETYVTGLLNPETKSTKTAKPEPSLDPNVRDAQDRLQRTLGLHVRIEDKNGKGRVIIDYSGVEDFDSLLSALGAQRA